MHRKLNFGCGLQIRDGWFNVDGQDLPCDARFDFETFPYPLPDGHFERILVSQVLEHIGFRKQGRVLAELRRVCAPGGGIRIEVPDLAVVCRDILSGQADRNDPLDYGGKIHRHDERVLVELLGGQRHERDYHIGGLWGVRLRKLLVAAGWTHVATGNPPDRPRTLYGVALNGPSPR